MAIDQIFERPEQILGGDAEHSRAHAEVGREQSHELIGMSLRQPVDQIQFRSHSPTAARFGLGQGLDDELGRSIEIRFRHDLIPAFGMDQNPDSGIFRAPLIDVARQKPSMNRAEASPKNYARVFQLLGRIAAQVQPRIPHDHLIERYSEFHPSIAAQMLIGKEKQLLALF